MDGWFAMVPWILWGMACTKFGTCLVRLFVFETASLTSKTGWKKTTVRLNDFSYPKNGMVWTCISQGCIGPQKSNFWGARILTVPKNWWFNMGDSWGPKGITMLQGSLMVFLLVIWRVENWFDKNRSTFWIDVGILEKRCCQTTLG